VADAPATYLADAAELELITRDLAATVDAPTALLVVWNADQRRLETICSRGGPIHEDVPAMPRARSGVLGRVLASGRTVAGRVDARRDRHLGAGEGVTYGAGAAVRSPNGPPGALCVGLRAKPADLKRVLWMVESYARTAALRLHGGTALDSVLAAARHDPLTGCLNYGAISSELEREVARSTRHGRRLSVCLIDLDGFKQVNDHHGHPQGSRILAELGQMLRSDVRIGDSVGRYGGDEFVVLLPDTGEAAASTLAERLRARLCTLTRMASEPLNASIGVAGWEAGMSSGELLVLADDAQRLAKRGGGGMVVGAGGDAHDALDACDARNGHDTSDAVRSRAAHGAGVHDRGSRRSAAGQRRLASDRASGARGRGNPCLPPRSARSSGRTRSAAPGRSGARRVDHSAGRRSVRAHGQRVS